MVGGWVVGIFAGEDNHDWRVWGGGGALVFGGRFGFENLTILRISRDFGRTFPYHLPGFGNSRTFNSSRI